MMEKNVNKTNMASIAPDESNMFSYVDRSDKGK
jgi:hypothetical protein